MFLFYLPLIITNDFKDENVWYMNFKFFKYFLLLIITFLFGQKLFAHDYYLGQLTIDHPYITKPMPGMNNAAGYMVIKNKGSKSDALLKVETLFSNNVEFHKMSMENNVMKMIKIGDGLMVPGGGELDLKPGGYHIMFKNLLKNLEVGKTEKAILYFEKTGKIIIKFEIHDMKHSH